MKRFQNLRCTLTKRAEVLSAFNLTEGAAHSPLPPTKSKCAFTLTEILLAVVIVGIIAALVLPAVVTHFQEKGFEQAYTRNIKTIESAIQGLAVNENKGSFFETMMFTSEEPESYEDNAELFLKKYLRVSKICGDNNKDCFGNIYYKYEDNDKKVYTPEFKGSCASLKNGASICITPQVNAMPITGIIDLNGIKGPNVFGKDLRTFSYNTMTRAGRNKEIAAVLETEFAPIETNDPCEGMTCGCGSLPECDPCEGLTCGCGDLPACPTECSSNPNNWDLTCCQANSGSITSPSHQCCTYSSIKNTVENCKQQEKTIVNAECVYEPNNPDGEIILAGGTIYCSINATNAEDAKFRFDVEVKALASGLGYRTYNATYFNNENMEPFIEFENTFEESSAYHLDRFIRCDIRDLQTSKVYQGVMTDTSCTFHGEM